MRYGIHKRRQAEQVDKYELNDTRCSRRDLSKSMNVRHDIVSAFLLFFGCDIKLFGCEILYSIIKLSKGLIFMTQADLIIQAYQIVLHLLNCLI